jgi:SAM-dependent methyltransferase
MNDGPRTWFTPEQYGHNYPDGAEAYYWFLARNRIVLRQVEEALGAGREGAVLDIGCGRGITVQFLRGRGVEALGCDLGTPPPISAAVAPHLHLATDARALPAGLRASARVILLLDVLEHLERPEELLLDCRRHFPACERLIVTVPARPEVWSNYDEHFGHFRRYDRASLAALLPAEDFELLRLRYFFHLLYLPALAMSALRLQRAVAVTVPSSGRRWAHRMLGALLAREERWLPGSLPGTSLLAVLRVRR